MPQTRAAYIGCCDGRLCLHHHQLLTSLGFDLAQGEVAMIIVLGGGATNVEQHLHELLELYELLHFDEVILAAHRDCKKIPYHPERLENLKGNIRWVETHLNVCVRAFIQHTHSPDWEPYDPSSDL